MRVSARLQASAAPEAPAPTITTSTGSSDIELTLPSRALRDALRTAVPD
jgi:hypothetical protein